MLRLVDTVLGLIRQCAPVAEAIGRRDAALARQFRDALSSVALNLAEGSGVSGARRTNHYAIARGSAWEALTALRTAESWGHIAAVPAEIESTFKLVINTIGKLVRAPVAPPAPAAPTAPAA